MSRRAGQMKRLQDERERLVAQMEALRNQIVGIDRAIALLEGTDYKMQEEARPRERARNVKDIVLGLLADAGATGLSVNQVLEKARAKGFELDRGTVSSLLSRLKREYTLNLDTGQYFIRPPTISGDARQSATTADDKIRAIR
jgi:hypothetical protein